MADEHDHEHDPEHDHESHHHDDEEAGGHESHHHDEEEAVEGGGAEAAEVDARRRLALAQIRQYPDSALRLVAHEVTEFDDDLRRLVDRMMVLMDDAQGVGLAATQVGVLRRLFVFAEVDEDPRVIVNPTVVNRSKETETDEEGCLSLPGVRVPVERATSLTLEGKDEHGADVHIELDAYGARIVQHEVDHLDGVLIIDRTDDEHRKQALSTLRPRVVLR